MILALRTDSFDAELYLLGTKFEIIDQQEWHAGRELSVYLLNKLNDLLATNSKSLSDLTGVFVYEGPGSFTGLRIGISVANTLGYGLKIPVIATTSEQWLKEAQEKFSASEAFVPVSPAYGSDPHITRPRK